MLRAFRPQVIHAFFAVPSGVPAVWLHRWSGVPLVLTLVGADVYDPDPTAGIATHRHPLVRPVVRRVIRAADFLTAISQDTRRRALLYHQAPRDITVIPLGLVPPVMPDHPLITRSNGTAVRLVTVGRLIPRKAHHSLLAALAALGRKDVTLDIVGDGPLRGNLQQTARALGISDRVTFHGSISDQQKWKLLFSVDCFVSSSLYEGFGIVFLEAMFAGLPIVATDQGGQTDFLTTGENALLVPPRSVEQLVAALAWVLRDAPLRARMAEANRAKARTFLINEIAARYEDVFQRVVQRSRVS
jgi:glycosyltransferase involved in cell wall biosynthesis